MVCGGPASTISHSHHNRDGCVLLRVGARSVIYAQVVGVASTADAVSKTLSVIPSESPALQWAFHVRDRMVAEDAVTSFKDKYLAAVIKFLLIPLKKNPQRRRTAGGCDSATLVIKFLQAVLELKPDAHSAETTFLTRERQIVHPVCLNALRIISTCRARCSSCNVNVGWRVRAQEHMAKSSIAAATRCPTLCSAL